MGVEKQGSKAGGGYVGGFLHMFDWSAKSRKKLFSSKSELPEQPKQKKRSDGNLPVTRFHLMDEDEITGRSSFKGSSCASSVTDEDVCGVKAPGVVARLMGLDSLPTSNFPDSYSNPSFDSQSLQDVPYTRKNLELHTGVPRRNVVIEVEPRPQRIVSTPLEKFQTETLPPKSAKSIPITHHKLLSPIKSPGFIPSKNPAHIMEAAAKIIESGRQNAASTSNTTKMPLVGSSSVPLKVRDLKEKVEAAAKKPSKVAEVSRRPADSNASKYLKGQSMNKSWNGSNDLKSFRVQPDAEEEEDSASSKSKGKSISLALQAKVNVQKREGLFGNNESDPSTTGQSVKTSQPNAQRGAYKKTSTNNGSSALRQNNQKQNSLADRGKSPSKSSVTNSQSRKQPVSENTSIARQKSSNKLSGNPKAGLRKSAADVTDSKKQASSSTPTTGTRRKRSIDGDFHVEKSQILDKTDRNGKTIQANTLAAERPFIWAEESKRKGMDVISFTFTAPIARSSEGLEKTSNFCVDNRGKKVLSSSSSSSSLGYNVIGGDALSTLLEQKLRELTNGVESSNRKVGTDGSSASIFSDTLPTFKAGRNTTMLNDKWSRDRIFSDDSSSQLGSAFSATDPLGHLRKYKLQEMEDSYECSGSNDREERKLVDCRHPSPISVLEPSFPTESCNSSDTADSNSTDGCKQTSSVQAQQVLCTGFPKKLDLMDIDTELSDSASSSTATTIHLSRKPQMGSTTWDLDYVKEILFDIESMFDDFALGHTREVINPRVFDQLESHRHEDEAKPSRKVVFDCVSECTDSRCRVWARGLAAVKRKDRLAEEVYKQVSEWESLGDSMVDELVDKDMSGQYGRWLDFDVEVFELGIDIERRMLNALVNEVVADILKL